jgi:tetratricopeptide (TPR) repeat protein
MEALGSSQTFAGRSRVWDAAGWSVMAAMALVLAWIAFRLHVVGDYSTESDFYGGYAEGARLIQRGRVEPGRYAVVGPGYDVALALVGFVFRDLFTAARLISVAGAVATLFLWRAIVRRRVGPGAAFWTIAFLGANALFVRYGYSATTDMLAIALQAATVQSVLASDGKRAPLRSGVLAALATLTRYNSIFLVPAALACYAGLAPSPGTSRRRAVVLLLGGFALVAAPWVAFSLVSGHLPGASLFTRFGTFYSVSDISRNVQDQLPAYAESLAAARSLDGTVARGPGAVVLQVLGNVPHHLRRDATDLLGLPVALLCLAGFVLACGDGRWRQLLPIWCGGALLFATLVPVFYSDRYSLAIAPAYLTLAGAALSSRLLAGRIRPAGFHLTWLVGLALLFVSARAAVPYQRTVLRDQPIEVIAAGRALARDSKPGDRVLSRKGQIGYHSGREVVPFPRLPTLAALGDYCRREDAGYLYYSWYEAQIRPEFAYFLDTTAAIPGLSMLFHSRVNPSVLYRVGPDFGSAPEWIANRDQLHLHLARARVQYLSAAEAAASHVLLASHALDGGDPGAALGHLGEAMKGGPLSQKAWRLEGEALRATGRPQQAIGAYERAVVMDPSDTLARLGLGWAQLGTGNSALAARAWRQAIGPRVDTFTLREMVRIYDQRGDRAAATAARAELARRGVRE